MWNRSCVLALMSVLVLSIGRTTWAEMFTVAPAGFEATDGTFISDGPLGTVGSGGARYQQIYDASLFSSFGGPQVITEIQFRAASPENAFRPNSVTAANTMISLSTTSVTSAPGATTDGAFSASFDDNVGANAQVVYSGALTLNRGGSNAAGAQPFEYGFVLQTPFVYNPSMGNLLLDVIVPVGAAVTQGAGFGAFESFDASVESGDGVASVRGTGTNSVGAAGQTGLITRFTSEAIPEPTSAMLLLAAMAMIGALRRR
jgi:hypothetical protein